VPRSKLISKDKGGDDKENGQGSEKAEKDEEKKKKRSKVCAVGRPFSAARLSVSV
jgi:hypothetical protein